MKSALILILTIAIAPILGIKLAHKLWAEKKIREEYLNNPYDLWWEERIKEKKFSAWQKEKEGKKDAYIKRIN